MALIVLLALGSSLFYGTSDFLGALAARRLAVLPATLITYLFGAAVIGVALLFGGWTVSEPALVAGSAAALFAIVGFVAFYAALAIGPMSLLSPAIAVIQALVPIVAAAVTGQALSPLGWGAVALAVVAGILISVQRTPGALRVTLPGAVLALVSGVTLGASIVALDSSPASSGLFPAFLEMAGGILVLALLMLALRLLHLRPTWLAADPTPPAAPAAATLPPGSDGASDRPRGASRPASLTAAAAGLLLGTANALLLLALHGGNLAAVSVLSALYPIATVILAALVLRERVSPTQLAGIALAVLAATLLSLS
ncbi:EamA family transporter [Herbiconiux solani]|uniref:EamA family transporter n=1 Tax=Herbiconiux solani TaxID=661329 RepID=UPI000825F9C2|nr:EamA family transporter [Herbiconiux solani]